MLRTGMGTLRRSGPWTVPSRIRVQSVMGSVILDFCDTTLPPVVDVTLELGAGSARLLLPDGATADIDGLVSGMGTVRSKVASTPVPGRPHFRVHGRSAMGSVTVRYRYRMAGTASERATGQRETAGRRGHDPAVARPYSASERVCDRFDPGLRRCSAGRAPPRAVGPRRLQAGQLVGQIGEARRAQRPAPSRATRRGRTSGPWIVRAACRPASHARSPSL